MPKSRSYPSRRYRRGSTAFNSMFWHGGAQDPFTAGPGTAQNLELTSGLPVGSAFNIGRTGMTILRCFITLRINSQGPGSVEAAFGFGMVDGDARAAGALPDPHQDPEFPWMYWDNRAFLPPSDSGQHMSLDIKAKRKFRGNDDGLVFVLDNHDAVETCEISMGFRMLIKRA